MAVPVWTVLLAIIVVAVLGLLEQIVKLTLMIVCLLRVVMVHVLMVTIPLSVYVTQVIRVCCARLKLMSALQPHASMEEPVKISSTATNVNVQMEQLDLIVNTTLTSVLVTLVEMEPSVEMALMNIGVSVNLDTQADSVRPTLMIAYHSHVLMVAYV